MKNRQFKRLLDLYISNEIDAKGKKTMDDFFVFFQTKNERDAFANVQEKESIRKEIFSNVVTSIKHQKRIRILSWFTRIAASIMIVFGIGYGLLRSLHNYSSTSMVTVNTRYGERRTVVLSDSSVVVLNAGSKLMYAREFSTTHRKVTLEGEAFFEVTRDSQRPFIIQSRDITTTVLGTSFSVHAYPDEYCCVTVKTGHVKVTLNDVNHQSIYLQSGEQAYLKNKGDEMEKRVVNSQLFTAWQNNHLIFNQLRFEDILKVLERNYGVKIHCSNHAIMQKQITTQYFNESLSSIIKDLQFMVNFKYEMNEDYISIY
ncbi:FecR family protein [Saccharicrinis fermentans]|nr:FecR family protein [Saccharicrinis fermentans]